jgi:hypothetical protein
MRKEQKNQYRVNHGFGKELKKIEENAKKLNSTTYQG